MELVNVLVYSVIFFALISTVLFIIKWSYCNELEKAFAFFVFIATFFELVALVSNKILDVDNNLLGMHVYTLLSFILLTLFFDKFFRKFNVNIHAKLLLVIGSIFIIANSTLIQSFSIFNSYSKIIVDIYLIILCNGFFVILLKNNYKKVEILPSIYFVTAIFFNACVTSIIYLFSNEVVQMVNNFAIQLWVIVISVNFITQVIILLGIFKMLNIRKGTFDRIL